MARKPGAVMLRWALLFLIIALIAGLFGFTSIVGTAVWFAKVVFFVFLVLFVVSILFPSKSPPDE